MKVINLFAGPGAGKSTTAAALFSKMKWKGYNVELVNEYAKDATWEDRHSILKDQLYLLAKQNRMLERLRDKVDYVITDSPLLLCRVYAMINDYQYKAFYPLIDNIFSSYDNINIFLERVKPYSEIGRSQNEEQAKEIDNIVNEKLIIFKIPFIKVLGDKKAAKAILEIVRQHELLS